MADAPFRSILVLVDGSESSARAIEYAIKLASCAGAKLAAISVVETETLRRLLSARVLVEQERQEFEEDLERSHRRGLDYAEQAGRKAGVNVETVLRKGTYHSAVMAEQKERRADLIVIAGFRTTFTKADLLSHERLLIAEGAGCPVLIIK